MYMTFGRQLLPKNDINQWMANFQMLIQDDTGGCFKPCVHLAREMCVYEKEGVL